MLSLLKGFSFDLPEEEPPVVPHKIKNRIELFIDKAGLVADNSNTENGYALAVLMVDFGDRDIEPALEPAD